MSLQIAQREREGITVLDLSGRLTVGQPASLLRETISRLQSQGTIRIVLNLADVDYIDSTGLGTLVICYTSLEKMQGSLRLANLNKRNLELLILTKLTTVFQLFNEENDAVNSFFPSREVKRFDILSFVQQHQQEQK